MFVLECAKGYYYGNTSSPTYGTGDNTGDPVGELVEQIGSCKFGDLGSVFSVFQFIYQNNGTSASMQYYLLDNNSIFQDQESLKVDIRLGNIETNFNLEYQIIGIGTKRSNYRISVNSDQNYATTNNQAADMIKHTVEDLEDKRIFVVATFYEKKTVIDVDSSSFDIDSTIIYDGQNHYTDTFTLYDTSGEYISSNDVTYDVVWFDSDDNPVDVVQDASTYRMRVSLSTPEPDRVTIFLNGVPYNKGTYIWKTLTITPQYVDPEDPDPENP